MRRTIYAELKVEWKALLLILAAALAAVFPLAWHGCSCGHDFDFHLVSWIDDATKLSHGDLHPLWISSPAFNAGEPRFLFYPPFSWMLGGTLGVLFAHLPWISAQAAWDAVPIGFTFVALFLSGTTLYLTARRYAGSGAAQVAAILYLVNPYLLFTAYERTAYGELLAAAWMPLLLNSILKEDVTVTEIALPVALLWLTNAPAAVMGCYTLAFLACFRLVETMRNQEAVGRSADKTRAIFTLRICGGVILGLSMSAIYLVPAVYERRFVQVAMATIVDMRIDHNFLFEHTGTSADARAHDQVLHTASLIAICLLCATCVVLATAWYQRSRMENQSPRPRQKPILRLAPLACLALGIAVMLTPVSLPLWHLVPEVRFLQFPWRLLAVLTPILALSIAVCLDSWMSQISETRLAALHLKKVRYVLGGLFVLWIAGCFIAPSYRAYRQVCEVTDTPAAWLAKYQQRTGTEPTDEYTPSEADNDALKPHNPPYWVTPSLNGDPDGTWRSQHPGPAPHQLRITTDEQSYLVLNLRAYPLWHVRLNGRPATDEARRDDGLIAIPIQPGASTIQVYEFMPWDVRIGEVMSLAALVVWMVLFVKEKRRRRDGVSFSIC